MNELERLLTDDVTRLIDRLAASLPDGAMERVRVAIPTLAMHLDEVDDKLAPARAALLDDYARWRRALEDAENIWALAAWRSAVAEEPATAA